MKYEARDARGHLYEYRLISSRLQRSNRSQFYRPDDWYEVDGSDFLKMTPDELRAVADCIERKGSQ